MSPTQLASGPALRLRTFGGLSLEHRELSLGGATVQPRRLAVLAVLAVAGERGLTRAKLLGLLWPDVDESRGRQALSQSLYALRRDSGGAALVSGSEILKLDTAVVASDVADLDCALAEKDLERVANLHAGPFLDGVYVAGADEFERWVEELRSHYAACVERAVETLASEADARGDYARAVEWWRRLTSIDPLRTSAALGVMRALAATGHRAEALRQADEYTRRVHEDLDAQPNAAVVELSAQLRAEGDSDNAQALLGGRYALERELGRGGMAVVFRARDIRHARTVAIKMLHPELSATLGRDRLEREIVITAGLRHPHILPLFDSGESNGSLFYVMPYVEGESLRARLMRDGPLPIAESIHLAREVAEALHHAHTHGVIHRDVKPENILLSEGHAVVMDFGIARNTIAAETDALTQHGLAIGTPAYMSPEQIVGEREIGACSDVFALGCVLFEMLTGRPPWIGNNAQALLSKRFVEAPPELPTLRPQVAASLANEVRRALAADPADRHETADAFARAIGRAAVSPETTNDGAAQLPIAPGVLVGRSRELEAARALVTRADVRLLTFTGAGGSGKTTLVLHLATAMLGDFVDGVRFVDLSPVSEPDRVFPAIAETLGARETEGRTPFEGVAGLVAKREMLLILDNVEQVSEAAPDLLRLLAACPRLTIVVTSRVRLRVRGEQEFFVSPLAVPTLEAGESVDLLRQSPAVDLFVRRADAARGGFEPTEDDLRAIAELCVRLDGLPLAIELAAARCRLLSPRAVLARIDHRFELLTGGARDLPARQQTLVGAIAWSYELLRPGEQRALRHLGVFAGGATLTSAAAVFSCTEDEVLEAAEGLADASLVRRSEDATGDTRLVLLESVRAYSRDRLREKAEEHAALERYLEFFSGLAERIEASVKGAGQTAALAAFDRDRDNLRVALTYAEQKGETLARLVAALWRAWLVRGRWTEGREWIARALAAGTGASRAVEAELLFAAATLSQNQGDYQTAYDFAERSRSSWHDAGDREGEARTLATMGWLGWRLCRFSEARRLSAESLAMHRELANEPGVAQALNNLGWVALFQGDTAAAVAHLEQSLAIRRALADQRNVAFTQTTLAWALARSGESARARALFAEARTGFEAIGERQLLAFNVCLSAAIDVVEGNPERALQELETMSVPIFREIGDRWGICVSLGTLGDALLATGRSDDARRAHDESLAIATAIGDPIWIASGLARRACAAEDAGDHHAAITLAERADAMLADVGAPMPAEHRAAFESARARARATVFV